MKRSNSIQTISFIGSGNVATHLAMALQAAGLQILEVFSSTPENVKKFADRFSCHPVKHLSELNIEVDLLILAVPDVKVEQLAKLLPDINGIVAHTSGITGIEALNGLKNVGVFYPLQTFTRDREMDISDTPFCIESANKTIGESLFQLAGKISSSVHYINSEERRKMHLAAVLVSNFSNHLYSVSHDFLQSYNLDFTLLQPLIKETAAKVQDTMPAEAQTGPARRNDQSTINSHLEMLKESQIDTTLYHLFSEQIKNKFHE